MNMFPTTDLFNGFAKKVHFESESRDDDATTKALNDTSWADVRSTALPFLSKPSLIYMCTRDFEVSQQSSSCSAT